MIDEKPKLTKAEREARSAARVAKMLAKCASEVGVPCPYTGPKACKRGCRRRAIVRGISSNRMKRNVAKAGVLAEGIERQFKARQSAERAALDAVAKVKKRKLNSDGQKFCIKVLYLCGYSVQEITAEGFSGVMGVVNRNKLADLRKGGNLIPILVEMSRNPPKGLTGYVEEIAARDRIKGLYREIKRVREIAPEAEIVKEIKRGIGDTYHNPNASALQRAARGGDIEDFNVAAGVILHGYFWRIPGGNVGAPRYDPQMIDNSAGDRDIRMAKGVDAANAVIDARATVESAFAIQGTSAWRWGIIDHVVLQDKPIERFALPEGMAASPARFLNDALLPVALMMKTAPSGVGMVPPTAEEWAAHELRKAMAAHRLAKMEKG